MIVAFPAKSSYHKGFTDVHLVTVCSFLTSYKSFPLRFSFKLAVHKFFYAFIPNFCFMLRRLQFGNFSPQFWGFCPLICCLLFLVFKLVCFIWKYWLLYWVFLDLEKTVLNTWKSCHLYQFQLTLITTWLEVPPSKERCAMCESQGQLSSSYVVNLMIF